jgi:hypothetical protein
MEAIDDFFREDDPEGISKFSDFELNYGIPLIVITVVITLLRLRKTNPCCFLYLIMNDKGSYHS